MTIGELRKSGKPIYFQCLECGYLRNATYIDHFIDEMQNETLLTLNSLDRSYVVSNYGCGQGYETCSVSNYRFSTS